MGRLITTWQSVSVLNSISYSCGHCGENLSSESGYYGKYQSANRVIKNNAFIYICHFCNKPTYFSDGVQIPSPMLGKQISKLPDDVSLIYEEIRKASSVEAHSLIVMGARKMLMHIAVSLGAAKNLKFVQYVDYLVKNGYVPPNSKNWVKTIKDLGNEANHEVKIMTHEDASSIISFLELLMLFNYEYADELEDKEENSQEIEADLNIE